MGRELKATGLTAMWITVGILSEVSMFGILMEEDHFGVGVVGKKKSWENHVNKGFSFFYERYGKPFGGC